MTEHSSIGPSALSRLLNCPASHKLAQKYPPGGSSVYAAEGTVAHGIVENALGDNMIDLRPDVGDIVTEDGHDITVDQDMLDGADQMIAFCEPLRAAAQRYWVEQRVNLENLWGGNPPEPIFGTVDFAAYQKSEDVLYVVDFKYGRIPVSPFDNPQAFAYALGACYELGRFPAHVIIVIVQPRGNDNSPVKIAQIAGLDLMMWAEEVLKPGVDALFSDSAPFATGDHCRFCPAKIDCPALYALAKKTSRVEFGELPPDPMKFTDAELGEILNSVEILGWWFEQVRAEASGRIEKGKPVPNWKLVPKRAMRKWADTRMVEKLLDGNPNAFKSVLISPTQLEKKDPHVYGVLVEEGMVDKTSSGTTLVPDNDPREAAKQRSAREEFGVIE